MLRFILCTCLALSLFSLSVRAADHPAYAVTAEAVQLCAGQITVSAKIEKMDIASKVGDKAAKIPMYQPEITICEGERGEIGVDNYPTTDKDGKSIPASINIDVISVKGQDNVLVLATVIEKGLVVWADTTTAKVNIKPVAVKK